MAKYVATRQQEFNGVVYGMGDLVDSSEFPASVVAKAAKAIDNKWLIPLDTHTLAASSSNTESSKNWLSLEPAVVLGAVDPETNLPKTSTVITNYNNAGPVNRPLCAIEVDSNIWVSGLNSGVSIFDSNFSDLGKIPLEHGHPITNPEKYQRINDMIHIPESNVLVAVMTDYHVVKAFDLDTGTVLWTIGDGIVGDYSEGRVYHPRSVVMLPNGNLLLCVFRGKYDTASTSLPYGYVIEIDPVTGQEIELRLECSSSGHPWEGQCRYPISANVHKNSIYISMYYSNVVGVWDVHNWTYDTSFTREPSFNIGSTYPGSSVVIPNHETLKDEIFIFLNGPKALVAIGVESHDVLGVIGQQKWDDRPVPTNTPSDFQDVRDILVLDDHHIVLCDYGNNRVVKIHPHNTKQCIYNLPDDFDFSTIAFTIPQKVTLKESDNKIVVSVPSSEENPTLIIGTI